MICNALFKLVDMPLQSFYGWHVLSDNIHKQNDSILLLLWKTSVEDAVMKLKGVNDGERFGSD